MVSGYNREIDNKTKDNPPSLQPTLQPSLKLRLSKKATVVKESFGVLRKKKDKSKRS